MTTTAIRKKVHQYVDHADSKVLTVLYEMLTLYSGENHSVLTSSQKKELDKTADLYHSGKMSASSWSSVKKKARSLKAAK